MLPVRYSLDMSSILQHNNTRQILKVLQKGPSAEGYKQAFSRLHKDFNSRATKHLVKNHQLSFQDAEDIVQQAFINLFLRSKNKKLDIQTSFWGYFRGMINNLTADWLKKKKRILHLIEILAGQTPVDTESIFIGRELEEEVDRILAQLSNPKCCALLFPEEPDQSMEQIAEELGYSNAGSASVMRTKCKKELIEILKKEGYIVKQPLGLAK